MVLNKTKFKVKKTLFQQFLHFFKVKFSALRRRIYGKNLYYSQYGQDKYILEYFAETTSFDKCDYCSNCNSLIDTTDITIDSKKILSCIKRMKERFGAGLVADVLKGSNSANVRSLGFDNLSTYGIMKDYSKDTIRDLISFLIAEDYIKSVRR